MSYSVVSDEERARRRKDTTAAAVLGGAKFAAVAATVCAVVHIVGTRFSPTYKGVNVYIKRIVGACACAGFYTYGSESTATKLVAEYNQQDAEEVRRRDAERRKDWLKSQKAAAAAAAAKAASKETTMS